MPNDSPGVVHVVANNHGRAADDLKRLNDNVSFLEQLAHTVKADQVVKSREADVGPGLAATEFYGEKPKWKLWPASKEEQREAKVNANVTNRKLMNIAPEYFRDYFIQKGYDPNASAREASEALAAIQVTGKEIKMAAAVAAFALQEGMPALMAQVQAEEVKRKAQESSVEQGVDQPGVEQSAEMTPGETRRAETRERAAQAQERAATAQERAASFEQRKAAAHARVSEVLNATAPGGSPAPPALARSNSIAAVTGLHRAGETAGETTMNRSHGIT